MRASRRPNVGGSAHLWIIAGVAVTTFIAFSPSLLNQFVDWDDPENFIANPYYRGFGWDQLKWMWTTFLLGHWVPVTWMTLGLDYLAWGLNPRGYHLTNVLLHSANAIVFYLVALRLLRAARPPEAPGDLLAGRLGAAFAALFFAVHPLRVESVAWVTERRDVLSGVGEPGAGALTPRSPGAMRTAGASAAVGQWWCRNGRVKSGTNPFTASNAPRTARTSENQNI